MNKTNIYNRNLFKQKFKDEYNLNKYNFEINDNILSNIINN